MIDDAQGADRVRLSDSVSGAPHKRKLEGCRDQRVVHQTAVVLGASGTINRSLMMHGSMATKRQLSRAVRLYSSRPWTKPLP